MAKPRNKLLHGTLVRHRVVRMARMKIRRTAPAMSGLPSRKVRSRFGRLSTHCRTRKVGQHVISDVGRDLGHAARIT